MLRKSTTVRFVSLALSASLASQAAFAGGSDTSKYPITVRGGDEASFTPGSTTPPSIVTDTEKYDAIIVGAGLGGLSAAVFLADHHKKVLLLEKESGVGGLAAGGALASGIRYDRGAAYWTSTYEEEQAILARIGLGDYDTKNPIHEPIDSYFWNGKLYLGMWENENTMEELPQSFNLFRSELKHANDENLIPNQPMEEHPKLELDTYNAAEWIRMMPARAALRTDEESKKIYAGYQRDLESGKIAAADPMGDVIGLMELYCRSALGTTPDKVSAVAFANFYISEIETRYTTNIGTGQAAENMEKILRANAKYVTIKTSAPVAHVVNAPKHVEVSYYSGGALHIAAAKYGIFAAQTGLAPRLINGYAQKAPAANEILKGLGYSHYSVHVVQSQGHPYRATYDTWTRAKDYSENDFTDVILGRWMDPIIHGFEGMRDFLKNPSDDKGIFTIYHPLPLDLVGKGYGNEQSKQIAEHAVDRMIELYSPLLKDNWGTKIDVVAVETNRWPYSVHVAKPGHFIHEARELRKPVGRVFFANNNLGTPAFEEALFRGHCAANNVLKRLSPFFKNEKWSRCPMEK